MWMCKRSCERTLTHSHECVWMCGPCVGVMKAFFHMNAYTFTWMCMNVWPMCRCDLCALTRSCSYSCEITPSYFICHEHDIWRWTFMWNNAFMNMNMTYEHETYEGVISHERSYSCEITPSYFTWTFMFMFMKALFHMNVHIHVK